MIWFDVNQSSMLGGVGLGVFRTRFANVKNKNIKTIGKRRQGKRDMKSKATNRMGGEMREGLVWGWSCCFWTRFAKCEKDNRKKSEMSVKG